MLVPGIAGVPYGLGLQLADPGEPARIGHGGDDQGFENYAVLYSDTGQGIVMMTNGFYGRYLIHSVVVPAVAQAYGWPGHEARESGRGAPGAGRTAISWSTSPATTCC